MTFILACVLIWHLGGGWYWYVFAGIGWLMHLSVHRE